MFRQIDVVADESKKGSSGICAYSDLKIPIKILGCRHVINPGSDGPLPGQVNPKHASIHLELGVDRLDVQTHMIVIDVIVSKETVKPVPVRVKFNSYRGSSCFAILVIKP
ncbi:hypothetical protein Mapa_008897 [Marchantia paleacea]|nr:hypothetical protein Mapa_008897 [Marchantia paleacea]